MSSHTSKNTPRGTPARLLPSQSGSFNEGFFASPRGSPRPKEDGSFHSDTSSFGEANDEDIDAFSVAEDQKVKELLAGREKECRDKTRECKALKYRIKELQDEVKELQNEVEKAKEETADTQSLLEAEEAESTRLRRELQGQIEELQSEIRKAKRSQIEELDAALLEKQQLEAENFALRAESGAKEADKDESLQLLLDAALLEKQRLEKQLDAALLEKQQLEMENENMSANESDKDENLQSQLDAALLDKQRLEAENYALRAESSAREPDKDASLQLLLDAALQEKQRLKKQLDAALLEKQRLEVEKDICANESDKDGHLRSVNDVVLLEKQRLETEHGAIRAELDAKDESWQTQLDAALLEKQRLKKQLDVALLEKQQLEDEKDNRANESDMDAKLQMLLDAALLEKQRVEAENSAIREEISAKNESRQTLLATTRLEMQQLEADNGTLRAQIIANKVDKDVSLQPLLDVALLAKQQLEAENNTLRAENSARESDKDEHLQSQLDAVLSDRQQLEAENSTLWAKLSYKESDKDERWQRLLDAALLEKHQLEMENGMLRSEISAKDESWQLWKRRLDAENGALCSEMDALKRAKGQSTICGDTGSSMASYSAELYRVKLECSEATKETAKLRRVLRDVSMNASQISRHASRYSDPTEETLCRPAASRDHQDWSFFTGRSEKAVFDMATPPGTPEMSARIKMWSKDIDMPTYSSPSGGGFIGCKSAPCAARGSSSQKPQSTNRTAVLQQLIDSLSQISVLVPEPKVRIDTVLIPQHRGEFHRAHNVAIGDEDEDL